MTATNHAITGAVIALVIKEPLLALPLAFLSHFVCDAIPHFGVGSFAARDKRPHVFRNILKADAFLLVLFFLLLWLLNAPFIAYIGALLAGSPDLIWAYRYIFKEDFGKKPPPPMNLFNRFHVHIQWNETLRLGFAVELIFGFVLLGVLIGLL